MLIREQVLSRLPPNQEQWVLVNEKQYVRDIIEEIMFCQSLFAPDYDRISSLFLDDSPSAIAHRLYNFCKRNIAYREETDERQTSALPAGFISRGYGDCKHYALFCGGVLASLNRLYGLGLKWNYYFAGYRGADTPHHVFVSVTDTDGTEIWIDPTPGAGTEVPNLLIKKTA